MPLRRNAMRAGGAASRPAHGARGAAPRAGAADTVASHAAADTAKRVSATDRRRSQHAQVVRNAYVIAQSQLLQLAKQMEFDVDVSMWEEEVDERMMEFWQQSTENVDNFCARIGSDPRPDVHAVAAVIKSPRRKAPGSGVARKIVPVLQRPALSPSPSAKGRRPLLLSPSLRAARGSEQDLNLVEHAARRAPAAPRDLFPEAVSMDDVLREPSTGEVELFEPAEFRGTQSLGDRAGVETAPGRRASAGSPDAAPQARADEARSGAHAVSTAEVHAHPHDAPERSTPLPSVTPGTGLRMKRTLGSAALRSTKKAAEPGAPRPGGPRPGAPRFRSSFLNKSIRQAIEERQEHPSELPGAADGDESAHTERSPFDDSQDGPEFARAEGHRGSPSADGRALGDEDNTRGRREERNIHVAQHKDAHVPAHATGARTSVPVDMRPTSPPPAAHSVSCASSVPDSCEHAGTSVCGDGGEGSAPKAGRPQRTTGGNALRSEAVRAAGTGAPRKESVPAAGTEAPRKESTPGPAPPLRPEHGQKLDALRTRLADVRRTSVSTKGTGSDSTAAAGPETGAVVPTAPHDTETPSVPGTGHMSRVPAPPSTPQHHRTASRCAPGQTPAASALPRPADRSPSRPADRSPSRAASQVAAVQSPWRAGRTRDTRSQIPTRGGTAPAGDSAGAPAAATSASVLRTSRLPSPVRTGQPSPGRLREDHLSPFSASARSHVPVRSPSRAGTSMGVRMDSPSSRMRTAHADGTSASLSARIKGLFGLQQGGLKGAPHLSRGGSPVAGGQRTAQALSASTTTTGVTRATASPEPPARAAFSSLGFHSGDSAMHMDELDKLEIESSILGGMPGAFGASAPARAASPSAAAASDTQRAPVAEKKHKVVPITKLAHPSSATRPSSAAARPSGATARYASRPSAAPQRSAVPQTGGAAPQRSAGAPTGGAASQTNAVPHAPDPRAASVSRSQPSQPTGAVFTYDLEGKRRKLSQPPLAETTNHAARDTAQQCARTEDALKNKLTTKLAEPAAVRGSKIGAAQGATARTVRGSGAAATALRTGAAAPAPKTGSVRASAAATRSSTITTTNVFQQQAAASRHVAAADDDGGDLPDVASEYSDSEDEASIKKRKLEPSWTRGRELEDILLQQASVDPDEIFGFQMGPVPLDTMLPPRKGDRRRARNRTSSANWNGPDGLAQWEIDRYNERMGISRDGGL
ncbi:hypothetical protein MSPP1_003383 [Malassezia sp. CBS 17886]|nr:hypothetical protein MSPP1_003383 [Malassezia sp. CBS 17886]